MTIVSPDIVKLLCVAEISFNRLFRTFIRREVLFLHLYDLFFVIRNFLQNDFGVEKHKANLFFGFESIRANAMVFFVTDTFDNVLS